MRSGVTLQTGVNETEQTFRFFEQLMPLVSKWNDPAGPEVYWSAKVMGIVTVV